MDRIFKGNRLRRINVKKVTSKQLQPGAVLLLQSGRMDLITTVDPQTSNATLMLAGTQTMSALGSSIFVGNIRYDHGEVQLGPQIEVGAEKRPSYTPEELAAFNFTVPQEKTEVELEAD